MAERRRRPFSSPMLPTAVAVIGLLLTAGGAAVVSNAQAERDEVLLRSEARKVADTIAGRLDEYVALLRAGTGLFATERQVSLREFRAFTRRLELRRRYPGIQGFGFSQRVSPDALSGTLAEMAANGMPAFLRPAEPRPEYHVIVYLEPLDRRNRVAIGYDMFTEATRRAAMERARDTGDPAASGRVTLVQEIEGRKQAGFLIYVPVYAGGEDPGGVAERREQLLGFVYAPFRADDLLQGILREPLDGLVLLVYDGPLAQPENLLHDSMVARGDVGVELHPTEFARERIAVAGRTWTVELRPTASWQGPRSTIWVVLGGLLATFLLVTITTQQVRGRTHAERLLADLERSERELRTHQDELRRLVHEAQAANQLKDEFLATVSHELRTPLQSILGWTSLLRSGTLDRERTERAVDTIDRNARAQAQIVEDVLDLSRIVSGRLRLEPEPVDLTSVVGAAVEVVRPAAEARQVGLETSLEPGVAVWGDASRLQQVFWNLLSNAVKFTPNGGRVHAVVRRDGDEAVVQVKDTGQGISPEFLPHVFDAFRQQDQTRTRRYGGLGLGLSIVRHLVEVHGGQVGVESEGPGQGSTFSVRLPISAVAGPPADLAAPERATDTLQGVRVLVTDDHPDARDTVATALSLAGAEVDTAESAREALERVVATRYDVLVCDIAMPDEDGFSLIARIRSRPGPEAEVPAIALTAYARVEERARCLEAGFQRHLAKPVDPAELRSVVHELATTPAESTVSRS